MLIKFLAFAAFVSCLIAFDHALDVGVASMDVQNAYYAQHATLLGEL